MTEHGTELVKFARARIEQEFGGPAAQPPAGAWTAEKWATFVTLRWRDAQGAHVEARAVDHATGRAAFRELD